MNKLIVGLTGGIASGKSVLADKLTELGCTLIDTDKISKELTADGAEGAVRLERIFPQCFENGRLNRKKLKELVFNDSVARALLNSTLHPLIGQKCAELIDKAQGIVVVAVPLLFETGFDKMVEKTVTVSAVENVRIQRLINRDNIDIALARSIMSAQMTDAEREKNADFIVRNDGDLAELDAQARGLYSKLKLLLT